MRVPEMLQARFDVMPATAQTGRERGVARLANLPGQAGAQIAQPLPRDNAGSQQIGRGRRQIGFGGDSPALKARDIPLFLQDISCAGTAPQDQVGQTALLLAEPCAAASMASPVECCPAVSTS